MVFYMDKVRTCIPFLKLLSQGSGKPSSKHWQRTMAYLTGNTWLSAQDSMTARTEKDVKCCVFVSIH